MLSRKNKYMESDSESSSEDEDIDIHNIVQFGTLIEIKIAVSKDRPKHICAKDRRGRIPLHYAVDLDREDVTVYLIAKQSLVNARDNKKQTPLHLAAMKGLTSMCRLLLENEANIKDKDDDCWTPLHHAVQGKYYDTATVLVKRGSDLKAEDHKFGRTPLHIAAENGFAEIAEMLIVRGSDMQAVGDNTYGKTPLHLACLHGHTDVTKVLVDRGADVAARSGFLDKTPLHLAAEGGHLLCASIIADTGTWLDVTGETITGCTPLHLAVENNHVDMVRLLVEKGANKEQWGKFTVTGPPLHYACQLNRLDCVRTLLSLGADINHRDILMQTPLHIACKYESYEISILLLELGADYRMKGVNGKLAIEYVVVPTMRETFKIIAERMDAIREEEEYLAREKAKREAVERHREEKRRAEEEERRERERVRLEQRHEAFKKLLLAACDVSGEVSALRFVMEEYPEQDYNTVLLEERGGTALTIAASRGFSGVVRVLLDWEGGIGINHRESESGFTALHYAAQNQDRDLVEELLLFPGIKLGLVNREGRVAVNYAKTSYMQEILRNPSLIVNKSRYQRRVLRTIETHSSHLQAKALTIADSSGSNLEPMISTPTKPLKEQQQQQQGAALPLSPSKGSLNVGAAKMAITVPNSSNSPVTKSGVVVEPLKSPIQLTLAEKAVDKFGVVPNHFGGSRADLFFKDRPRETVSAAPAAPSKEQQLQLTLFPHLVPEPAAAAPPPPAPKSLVPLQYTYHPTSFDLTSEYCEVKDFLWLIGYPYKPVKKETTEGAAATADGAVFTNNNLEESDAEDNVGDALPPVVEEEGADGYYSQSQVPSEQQQYPVAGVSASTGLDKKYQLYRLGLVMDSLQRLFTDTHLPPEAPAAPPSTKLPAIASAAPVSLTQTVASTFLQHSSRLPAITAKGAVQSYVSETSSVGSYLNPPGTNLYDPKPGCEEVPSSSAAAVGEEGPLDFTHHYCPSTLTARDYARLIEAAKQCDLFVEELVSLYEPDYYGWPEVNGEGYYLTLSDKLELIQDSQIVSEAVILQLRRLIKMGYNQNNEECRVKWEQEQSLLRLKRLQKVKRRSTYSEATTQNYNIFSRGEEGPESSAAAAAAAIAAMETEGAALSDPAVSWELFANAPRYLRSAVDTTYEVAHFIYSQAEHIYELDAVRAHLWAHSGRTVIEKRLASSQNQNYSPLQRWLLDIKLLEYEQYFAAEGFKVLEDFEGLSEQDCRDFFPFLKIGDCRRFVKHVYILTDEVTRR